MNPHLKKRERSTIRKRVWTRGYTEPHTPAPPLLHTHMHMYTHAHTYILYYIYIYSHTDLLFKPSNAGQRRFAHRPAVQALQCRTTQTQDDHPPCRCGPHPLPSCPPLRQDSSPPRSLQSCPPLHHGSFLPRPLPSCPPLSHLTPPTPFAWTWCTGQQAWTRAALSRVANRTSPISC